MCGRYGHQSAAELLGRRLTGPELLVFTEELMDLVKREPVFRLG